MIAAIIAGALAGYGIAIPVGAVGVQLMALAARSRFRVAACAALGVATADGCYALLAVLGGTALGAAMAPILAPVRSIAGIVLLALAVGGAARAVRDYRAANRGLAVPRPAAPPPGRALRAYGTLLGVTLLNPMTVLYFGALVLGGAPVSQRPAAGLGYVIAAFTASASWQLLLATGGTLLGRLLSGRRGRLGTAVVSSTVITALAVPMIAAG